MSDIFMDTYKRTGLVFVRGSGSKLYTADGAEYIDFTSGIGVNALGHGHPALVEAISSQAAKMLHISNYFLSDVSIALATELRDVSGCDRIFLCNSGAEANEALIKIARKRGNSMDPQRNVILTLKGSFHGRTLAALTATGQDKFHVHFGPFPAGFRYVEPNDIQALRDALDETVCGFIFEPVQGEGGVTPLDADYLRAAQAACRERGIMFIADEVQCGVGRTGTFLASEQYGIRPDLVAVAKGIAGGVPMGAVLAYGAAAEILKPGDHGSTFGGNPLASAASRAVLSVIRAPEFMESVAAKGNRMMATIRSWNHPIARGVRGMGLMIGIPVTVPPGDVVAAARGLGLLVLTAGEDTVRLLPPLVITDAEMDRGLAILKAAMDKVHAEKKPA